MNPDEIRNWYYARPFKPFEIELNDGQVLRVPEPYGLAFTPDGKRLLYSKGETFELHPFATMKQIRAMKAKRRVNRGNHRKAS